MENKNHFNEMESLRLIESMIAKAKNEIREDGFLYLLWGWLVLIAALLQYTLLKIFPIELNFIGWPVLMLGGAAVNIIYSNRQQKRQRVKSYLENFIGNLWIGFSVSLAIVIPGLLTKAPMTFFPVILILYGLAIFVSGRAIRFLPLVIGGIILWTMAIASFLVDYANQLLLVGTGVLAGYIIPGFLLNKSNKQNGSIQGA